MSTVPYHTLLTDQLADERAKKNSLEQRGIAVITTSGTLVTITLGFVALATRAQTYVLGPTVVALLVVALAGLVLAAAAGLVVNLPARLPVVDAGEFTTVNGGDDLETVGAEHEVLAHLLTDLRQVNRPRARILFAGLLVEVTALAVMAVAVVVALTPMMS